MFLLVAFGKVQVSDQQFQEGGLATTIRPYKGYPVVHIYSEIKVLEQHIDSIIAEVAFRNGHAGRGQLLRIREVERVGVFFLYDLLVVHPVQHLYTTLHHTRQDLVGSELVDEPLSLFPFLLHLHRLFVMVLGQFSQGLLVHVVVASIVSQLLVLKYDHFLTHLIQELPIMTNHDHCYATFT